MFARFFGGNKPSEPQAPPAQSAESEVPPVANISIEFDSISGGGKGWPIDATYLFYHRYQGVICVGTSSGAIFVYGDGFQFIRPWVADEPSHVISMQAIQPNNLLVAFGDNSLALFELPSMTLVSMVPGSWLAEGEGDISAVYSDDVGGKSFVYVGTTIGNVYVFDVKNSIRECDYIIGLSDVSMTGEIAVSEIQICPKDEKYLAIAYDGSDGISGATIIFDLTKRKVFKDFKVGASTSICWNHQGEVLYVGNRAGEVYQFSLEKESKVPIYRSKIEKFEDDFKEEPIVIRRLQWLAPQASTGTGSCLFILLSHVDSDPPIKNIIVGLAPDMGLNKDGTMNQIFALAPTPNEEIFGFRLVPSANPIDITRAIVPALLLLTQKVNLLSTGDNRERNLKILQCPDSNLSNWEMEIGSLPEPSMSSIVLPGLEDLTCISGSGPSLSRSSFIWALYASAEYSSISSRLYATSAENEEDERGSSTVSKSSAAAGDGGRRISTNDFVTSDSLSGPNFELILATGSDESINIVRQNPQNSIALGHADGNLIIWAVSRPEENNLTGRGTLWFPIKNFKFGTTEVSALFIDEKSPVFVAGDISGSISLWETFDSASGLSYSSYYHELLKAQSSEEELSMKDLLSSSSDSSSIPTAFVPNSWKQNYQCNIGEEITAVSFYAEICCLAIGTISGNIYLALLGDYSGEAKYNLKPTLANVSGLPRRGDVIKIVNSSFFDPASKSIIPVFYVFYSSGGIGIINPFDGELLNFSVALTDSKSFNLASDDDDDEDDLSALPNACRNSESFTGVVLDGSNSLVPPLTLQNCMELRKKKTTTAEIAAPVVQAETAKKSFWDVVKTTDKETLKSVASSPAASTELSNSPRFLLVRKGRHLIQLDITKFCSNNSIFESKKTGRASLSITIDDSIVIQKVISRVLITCSQIINWTEEASRAWAKPLTSFAMVNCDGTVIITSVSDKGTWGHADLIDGLVSRPAKFEQGLVLSNGDVFLVKNKCIIYSSTVKSETHIITDALAPAAAVSQVIPAASTDQLSSGREKLLVASATALKKRRQSIFTITSGPTDLDMIFAKTREPRRSGRRGSNSSYGGGGDYDDDDEDASIARQSNDKLAKTQQIMNDTKMAFLERGEKLKQMNIKGERMQADAEQYKQNAKAYKEKLKAKADRWGFF